MATVNAEVTVSMSFEVDIDPEQLAQEKLDDIVFPDEVTNVYLQSAELSD